MRGPQVSGQQPHIIQVHDWHAAAVPMLYWQVYHNEGLWRPRLVLTIHNMDNTGECRQDEFSYTGVPGECFATVDKALDERTIGEGPLCFVWGRVVDGVRALACLAPGR